jgi:broad specificity phosphatase PhoE
MWEHGYPAGEDSAAVQVRCQRIVDVCRSTHGDVALFAHGHILRSLAAVWLGLGADKVPSFVVHAMSLSHVRLLQGKCLALSTGTISVLGYEHGSPDREIDPVILRWNAAPSAV